MTTMRYALAAALLGVAASPVLAGNGWNEHSVLSRAVPMTAVSLRDMTDAATTQEFFSRLTALGFTCTVEDSRYYRTRRAEVTCANEAGRVFVYAGGWSGRGDSFVVDRLKENGH